MAIERYLEWMEQAPAVARADAARALVAACGTTADRTRSEHIETMLSALLDDHAIVVRCALAEAAAHSLEVPAHVVVALAQDDSMVSVPVLRHSPLLTEADLVDAVAIGDAAAQTAVASRACVTAAVAAALAEVGHGDALLALCRNSAAEISSCSARRIIERFGEDGAVREALLGRPDLDPALRHDLVEATARVLTAFAISCDWMSPERADCVRRESRDKAAVTIALRSARAIGADGPRRLVAHLKAMGHLTPALILRSLLSGNLGLFEAALADLSGVSAPRVAGYVRSPAGLGFASLYAKAAMPPALLPVFRAALQAITSLLPVARDESAALCRPVIRRVLESCARSDTPDLARVAALLRRFEAEAVRDDIRAQLQRRALLDSDDLPDVSPWMLPQVPSASRLPYRSAA